LVRGRTIDANAVGSGPWPSFAVGENAVAKPGNDGDAALSRGIITAPAEKQARRAVAQQV
jgi:hypothetical protein